MRKLCSTAVVVGVGLIGGSLAMALKKNGLVEKIVGVDVASESLDLALEMGAIDQAFTSLQEVPERYGLLVLAAPVSVNRRVLRTCASSLQRETVITDVGSTKAEFVADAEQWLGGSCSFVGGHPMAGSEITGVHGADPYLFENAVYLLTPTPNTSSEAVRFMKRLVEGIGAKPVCLSPEDHDAMVAAVSHVPQIIASSLANTAGRVEERYPKLLELAAGGFRDTTRIAGSNPQLWRDICFSNRARILDILHTFQEVLSDYTSKLQEEDACGFVRNMEQAREVRSQVPKRLKGYWPWLEEVIVTIPDEPGMIGRVAGYLGQRGVNIDDIEILHLREGEGGTLRLGFAQEGAAAAAIDVLHGEGLPCRRKHDS